MCGKGTRQGSAMGNVLAVLLVITTLVLCSLACADTSEWEAWQAEVMVRQRAGLATSTPAWGGVE